MIITIFIFNKNSISLNYPFFILLILFPLFFYTGVKDGIGRVNSFPSIIDRQMKESFSWKLDLTKIKKCDSIIIKANYEHAGKKSLKVKYLIIYMLSNNIKHMISNDFFKSDKNENDYDCEIFVKDSGFYLKKL